MDWTTFGNIINVLAGLVTVGAPIFSVLKAVVRSKQNNVTPLPASLSRSQGQVPLHKGSHIQSNTIPWYMWVKAIFYTLMHMIEAPITIFFYFFGGLLLIGVIFVFCFLVGIPVGW